MVVYSGNLGYQSVKSASSLLLHSFLFPSKDPWHDPKVCGFLLGLVGEGVGCMSGGGPGFKSVLFCL